jgi:cytochrome P450
MTTILELDLPQVDPYTLRAGEPPWHRYEGLSHEHWAARCGDAIVIVGFEETRAILSDPRFHQGLRVMLDMNTGLDPRFVARRKQSMLVREGPDHQRLRGLALRAFTPKAIDRHRPYMREVMTALSTGVPDDGCCDAVATLTQNYPIPVMCRLLGAPIDDLPLFSRIAEDVLNAQSAADPEHIEAGLAAHDEIDAYMRALIERRRNDPGPDLLSDLIHAEEDEGRLTVEELVHLGVSVIVAGTDTTRNELALALHLFADHPDQWDLLGDRPELAATAAEEVTRYAPIGHVLARVPDRDIAVNDVVIPAGRMVSLFVAAANRDPRQFPDPDRFDITRASARSNLAFGHGPKYCLGVNLARAELAEALSVLRSTFDRIEHTGEATWRTNGFLQGPVEMPLRFTRVRAGVEAPVPAAGGHDGPRVREGAG